MNKKIELNQLKKIQIEILNYIDNFCKKNDINYWIDCGTLLGAIRHKGYIPWDDDIDIGMLREDYNKFLKLYNNKNNRYKFYCCENNKDWYYPLGKVLDTNTVLYEPNEDDGIKISINIDVFVYDNAPSNERKLKKMYKIRDFLFKLNSLQIYSKSLYKNNSIYNFIRLPFHLFLKFFPKGFFAKMVIRNSKKYENDETGYVGNFTSYSKFICDKSVFDSFVDVEFENNKYRAPVSYDLWLKMFYGDYMKLPPKEKQVSHHSFVAYYK